MERTGKVARLRVVALGLVLTCLPAPAWAQRALTAEQEAWVERTLAGMSVREMAGQLIVAWVPGSYVSLDGEELERAAALVDGGVGGLWMMAGLPHARAAKANALQARAQVPLLVTGSGWFGQRLFAPRRDAFYMGGGTDLPPQLAYGAIGDPFAVAAACRIAAIEGLATGSHTAGGSDLANVLTNHENVLIERVFGDDPEQVGRLAAACIAGAHEAGALTSAGFFPGAGDLGEDPHVRLPILAADRRRLDTVELVPFRHAIRAGTDHIMTSHFAVPAITGSNSLPATLSPEVIAFLRQELGYDGLVITDAFDMGALSNNYQHYDAAIRAFLAGHDLLLGPAALPVADTIAALVRNGAIPRQRLERSVRRILTAKARLGLHERRLVDLEDVNRVVGRRAHQAAADSAADRSIVLLRDRSARVPLNAAADTRVLSVTMVREDVEGAGNAFHNTLRPHVEALRSIRLAPSAGAAEYEAVRNAASEADIIVVSIYLGPRLGADPYHMDVPDPLVRLVEALEARGLPVVVISFGKLTVLDQLPELGSFMLAWSGQDVMQRAAARALLGEAAISGRLPVALPPHHATGDGLSRPGPGDAGAGGA